ncbi:MAG TPA: phosphoribosyltransferase [Actinobacteria bacterium]|nr:phosphoribosyltransferase [Actinomycetota bacterium]
MFVDRIEAGQELGKSLVNYRGKDVVVVAIPRGGVLVAKEVAIKLEAPLELVIPRKIGAPGNPELAIGAMADKDTVIINEHLRGSLRVLDDYLKAEVEKQAQEIERRRKRYLGAKSQIDLENKIIILVDDGLATGYTALAAIKALRRRKPKKLILAVPVAPKDTIERLGREVDELICLHSPEIFFAVGQFYSNFSQTTDDEVIQVLKEYEAKEKG